MKLVRLGIDNDGCVIDVHRLLSARLQPADTRGERNSPTTLELVIALDEGQTHKVFLYDEAATAAWKELERFTS